MIKKILSVSLVAVLPAMFYAQVTTTETESKIGSTDSIQIPEHENNLIVPEEVKETPVAEKQDSDSIKHWTIEGLNSVMISQNTFSNWKAGGVNSFGLAAKADYSLNYKKDKHRLENKGIISYGVISNKEEKPKKTDDILSISSDYGYEFKDNWFFELEASLKTQIANGYDYSQTPKYTTSDRTSSFMAPGYLNAGAGITYTPIKNMKLSLLPIGAKITMVLDKKLQKKGNYGLKNDNDAVFSEIGGFFLANYKAELMKNIDWETDLSLFSSYSNHPERIDINYINSLNLKINDYITSNIYLEIQYDHDQVKKTQIKQTLGVGLAYKFKK